jgi:hypothetical protein
MASRGTWILMKRTFAIVTLLASMGVLIKLATKPVALDHTTDRVHELPAATVKPAVDASVPEADTSTMLARYQTASPRVREMVARLADRFGRNAVMIDRTDGERGLVLLDELDMEALLLYEKYPAEFHRLRDVLGADAAADVLLHWREYFGMKRGDDTDRGILIAELTRLTPAQRRAASRYPAALPLILAEPQGMTALIERMQNDRAALGDVLTVLGFISLERGASDLRSALRTFEHYGPLAREAFRRQGLEGFALVSLYGPVLEALGDALPLEQALILAWVNADYLDELLQTHQPETVAKHLRHVAAAGLVEAAGSSTQGLRLIVEQGDAGERALKKAGPDAADVVFGDFSDATLRRQATLALGMHGAMALVILDKYATDPDFRDVLRKYGAAAIPPIAEADAGPQTIAVLQAKSQRSFREALALSALSMAGGNGQVTIRTIRNDGLERVAQLGNSSLQFYQFLPLYDVIHLGNVMRQGYAPTSGELTWALIDGCFVVADVLSLSALQPEAAAATEALRSEVKGAVREGVKTAGRELAEAGGESAGQAIARQETVKGIERAAVEGTSTATERLLRWWTVRSAGGVFQVLRRLPEALPRLSLTQITGMAGPICTRAGLRLTTWRPVRYLKEGVEVVLRIPPERGLKYLTAQMVQASVGVVGFQKMEEHLRSRRPNTSAAGGE